MLKRREIINDLAGSMQQTLALFDSPPAAFGRAYAPGKWTLRELLIHISDTETVLLDRLRRIASDKNPMLAAFDQDRWARELFYGQRDLNLAKMQFQAARGSVIELATLLDESVDAKTGTHSEAGSLTFAKVLQKICEHNLHHLEQAHAAIGGRVWTAPQH